MPPLPFLLACLLPLGSLPLLAQSGTRTVPPGRELRDGKLLSLGQTDVWNVVAEADEVLQAAVETTAFDPVLELVDADGRVLASDNGRSMRSEVVLRVPHKGPLQFRVHGFRSAGGGTYTFWLQRFRTEALGSRGEASHTFGQEQWWHYRVGVRTGDVLVPTTSGDGRVTAVFDAERRNLAERHGGYLVEHDGDVYVRIEGEKDRRCQLTTQLARRRDVPPTPVVDDAVPSFGFDVWRWRVAAGSAWSIELAMPGEPLDHEVREAIAQDGPAFVWRGNLDKGGCRRAWLMACRDTTLEVLLRNHGRDAAVYRLALAQPEVALAPGAVTAGTLVPGHGDLYRLDLEVGQLVRVRMASTAFDARFDLWDPDGAAFASVDDRGPLDRDAEHTFLVPRRGRYRLLGYTTGGAGGGAYTLQAEVLAVPVLEVGGRQVVQLQARGTGYLHLPLRAGQEVWIAVRSRAFDAGLTVLDPHGDGGFTAEGGGCGGDVLVAYVARTDGEHTLLVHSRSGAGAGEVRVLAPDAR